MVARRRCETGTIAVIFSRDGEPPQTERATDANHALEIAVRLLITNRKLRGGDRVTVEVAN
jgi:hypothetical protein